MKFSIRPATTAAPAEPQMQDPFAAFHSETAVAESWHASPAVKKLLRYWRPLAIALVVAVIGAVVATVWFNRVRSSVAAPATNAAMTVTSDPAGAIVFIDGKGRGTTPISFTVTPGRHRLTLRAGEASQELQVTAKANVETVQHVMMVRPVGTTGSLSVQSEPPALQVAIDGTPRGVTPTLVEALAPGHHDVLLTGKGINTHRSVSVTAGATTSLLVSEAAVEPAVDVGSVQITSPIEVALYDGDTLVGSSRSARLYLKPGTHTLNAVNEELNFRRAIQVSVAPGATARVTVPVPNGTLSVNAQPWAEVLLDGASLGETPIGNISVPLGAHELVFRHPQLGERRQTVVVTAGQPVRVAQDLRK